MLEVVLLEADGDEQTLIVTPEHPLQGVDGWQAVGQMDIGEQVSARDGWAEVVSIAALEERQTVYNFEVEGTHTYFVGPGGVWAHNGCGPRGKVLKRDLTKGPHAPDTPISKLIDRANHGNKAGPQGRWNSRDAAERAAGQATGKGSVPIQPGDGVIVTPLSHRSGVWIRQADKAATLPKGNGTVHTFPIGPEHPLY